MVVVGLLFGIAAAQDEAPKEKEKEKEEAKEGLDGRLHGDFPAIRKPLAEYPLPVKGRILALRTTSDAKRVVIREELLDEKKDKSYDRISAVELATGKVTRLQEWEGVFPTHTRLIAITADDSAVVLEELEKEHMASLYDLATGKVIRRYEKPEGKGVGTLTVSADRKRMAGGSRDFGAVYWNLDDSKPRTMKLDFTNNESGFYVRPVSGSSKLLVITLPAPPKDGGKRGPVKARLVDPESGKVQKLLEDGKPFDIQLAPDGSRAFVLRQNDPDKIDWTDIETWSIATAEKTGTLKLKFPLVSIGLWLTADSKQMFAHQYMMQQGLVLGMQNGALAGAVGPEQGGFTAFDITADGKKLVGLSGDWVEGDLKAEKIAVYDTSPLVK